MRKLRQTPGRNHYYPLYSEGKFHGPDTGLQALLEPIFEKYHVNVVFAGHDYVYERIKPQNGIYYFVLGSSGELRLDNSNDRRRRPKVLIPTRLLCWSKSPAMSYFFKLYRGQAKPLTRVFLKSKQTSTAPRPS